MHKLQTFLTFNFNDTSFPFNWTCLCPVLTQLVYSSFSITNYIVYLQTYSDMSTLSNWQYWAIIWCILSNISTQVFYSLISSAQVTGSVNDSNQLLHLRNYGGSLRTDLWNWFYTSSTKPHFLTIYANLTPPPYL